MAHFNILNQQIETASRKFLADIETWRKQYFHELKTIVDDYGIEEPDEWLEKLRHWAEKCYLWPGKDEPQHRLKRCPQHWQTRAFIWTTKLKRDLVMLIHERTTLTRQRITLYQQLDLRYSSALPELVEEIQKYNLELNEIDISTPPKYHKAINLREKIDNLLNLMTQEVLETEKPLDLMLSDASKSEQTTKLLKIRAESDENLSALSLVKRYLDWAANEPYIAEVIRYLDKADAIMTHTTNQLSRKV